MKDYNEFTMATLDSPANSAYDVTPSDSNPVGGAGDGVPRGIYVGGAGTLKVDMYKGGTVTFQAVPAGTFMPIRVNKVYATGTSATNLIAIY